jgi:hypothetical protein
VVSGLILQTKALFRLAFASAPRLPLNLACKINSPVHSSIGTPSHVYSASTACRHTVSGSFSLRSRGSFHLSLTVLCAIGRSVVFCLGWWSTRFPTGFLVSRGTLDSGPLVFLSPTRVSLSLPLLPRSFGLKDFDLCRSATPLVRRRAVWALPFSLAATRGISVDYFSSGYLDVSVHRVVFLSDAGIAPGGLPHSGTHGSLPTCGSPWLFAAYRAFLRLGTPRHPPYALLSLTFCLV